MFSIVVKSSIWSLDAKLTVAIAKCLDTYIALSAMHNPPTPISKAHQAPPQLMTSFDRNATGGASTAAGLTSPITPFSQSALPSKSLLSREDSTTFDPNLPGGGNAGVAGAHPTPSRSPTERTEEPSSDHTANIRELLRERRLQAGCRNSH